MRKKTLLVLGASSLLLLAACSSSEGGSPRGESSSFGVSSSEVSAESSADSSAESSGSSSSIISSSEEAKTFAISAESDGGAEVTLGKASASYGEEVHFTVSVLDGFALGEVSAQAGASKIALTVGLDGDYSFIMPKRGVAIKVSTSRKSYKLSVSDVAGFITSITQKKAGATDYVKLDTITEKGETDEEGEATSTSYSAAQYGAEVLLSFNADVAGYDLSGVSINGEDVTLSEGATSYSFTMPAKASNVSILYSYKKREVKLVDSSHIELSLFADSSCEKEIDGACAPYSNVYLKATPKDDDYGVKTITCSYTNSSGSVTTKDLTSFYDESSGLYPFTFPMSQGEVKISVTEYNLHAYRGASFVGDYLVCDFSYGPVKDYDSFMENASFTIEESGDLTYAKSLTSKYEDYAVSTYEESEGDGLIRLTKAGAYSSTSIAYDGNVLVFDSYLKTGVYESNDLSVAFKKAKSDASYSIKATQFKLGETTYALSSFYEGDSLIESLLIERGSRNLFHFGVDVEMLEGESVNEKEAVFRVKEGGDTLLSVGYLGDGGAANRSVLGEEYGDYSAGEGKSLHLNGSGKATYDGVSYSYQLSEDGTSITLTSNDLIIKGTIDKGAMSFALISEEQFTMSWKGKSYKGTPQFSSSDSGSASFSYTAVFAEEGMSLTWVESYTKYSAEVSYELESGTTIKTTFYNIANKKGSSKGASITLSYNAEGDYFIANGGLGGAYFKDTKMSLVS